MTTPIDEETVHNIIILVEGEGEGLENQADLDEEAIQDPQYEKYGEEQQDLDDEEEGEEEDGYQENDNQELEEEIDAEQLEVELDND